MFPSSRISRLILLKQCQLSMKWKISSLKRKKNTLETQFHFLLELSLLLLFYTPIPIWMTAFSRASRMPAVAIFDNFLNGEISYSSCHWSIRSCACHFRFWRENFLWKQWWDKRNFTRQSPTTPWSVFPSFHEFPFTLHLVHMLEVL